MKKVKVLFVITSMGLGGAQRALVSLFNSINYEEYEVDLLLYYDGGFNLKFVPENVNILPSVTKNVEYFCDTKEILKRASRNNDFQTCARALAYLLLKKIKAKGNEAVIRFYNWKFLSKYIPEYEKKYDVAISFLDGTTNYYVIDKVAAKKKVCWVHNDYSKIDVCLKDYQYLKKAHTVATISPKCVDEIHKLFPRLDNVELVYNINSPALIKKLSCEIIDDPIYFEEKRLKILSVGRITEQKAFHLAVEAADLLNKKNINFHWYILGDGELHDRIQQLINEKKLNGKFTILGLRENPYPYIAKADIIVQSSIYEGKSIVLDEAKILNKIIVCTNYNSAIDQITDEETGLLVPISGQGIADGIDRIIHNQELSNHILQELSTTSFSIDEYYKKYKQIFKL